MVSDFLYNILKIIKSRIFIVSVIVICMFAGLIYRIFDLQIVNENYYMSTYIQQAEKTIYNPGTRGRILDAKGKVLAYDSLAYSVVFEDKIDSSDTKNAQLNKIVSNTIKLIEKNGDTVIIDFPIILNSAKHWEFNFASDAAKKIFYENIFNKRYVRDNKDYRNANPTEIMNYLKDDFFEIKEDYNKSMLLKMISIRYNVYCTSYQKYVTTTIAKDVSKETAVAIQENTSTITGVSVEQQTVRKYNNSMYFAPIIGYTGKISDAELEEYTEAGKKYVSNDIVGKAGIEQACEDELQGVHGETKIFVDSTGKVLSEISSTDASAGNDIYLTIDSKMQIAAYKLLEKKIAAILISEIKNYDVDEKSETDDDIHYISAKKVYAQLVTNNVVSLEKLIAAHKTDNEKKLYKKYTDSMKAALKKLHTELEGEGTKYNDLSDEFQEYDDYIYEILKTSGILLTSTIDTENQDYQNYINGKTSINTFLKAAIRNNWIDIELLGAENEYLSSDETYDLILQYLFEDLENNTEFSEKVVYYRIFDGTVSGSEICMLLYDQGILEKDRDKYARLQTYDTVYCYQFIIDQIKKLKITPAQLALDPCSGSIVVTDPNTGQVTAMVTYPSYDNNKLSGSVDPDYWNQLLQDQSDPLYNRATQGATAPGSTFKMCTAMAALEEDLISLDETVNDTGVYKAITPSPKCWIYPSAHGPLNVEQAIAQSCNYFFYEMGYRLGSINSKKYDSASGLERLETYATKLGLNMKSGVEITEREPHFSTESAVHSAIGQGSNAYTPVQLARYVSTIANGGTNNPLTLIGKVTSGAGKLVSAGKPAASNKVDASASTWEAIHTGMRMVITSGTVQKYFNDTKIKIAGKSGTAQENKHRNSHSVFVAYAPYDNPKMAVSVVIPFGNSSHDSAELAKNVIQYQYGELTDKDINKEVKKQDASDVTQD